MSAASADWQAALDPARCAVVEACAGSGKTWLIAARIVRALLAGAAPGEILAITFTRKAAGEMRARVAEWLERLALDLDDDEAVAFLVERGLDAAAARAALPRARALHEAWLVAQPPATIDTFHGWFGRLVGLQPLKAAWDGQASWGQVLDENAGRALRAAWQRLAARCGRDPAGALARALATLLTELGLSNTRDLLFAFATQRAEWWAYTAGRTDAPAWAAAMLRGVLNVDPAHDPAAQWFAAWGERVAGFARLLERKGAGATRSDRDDIVALEQALATGAAAFEQARDVFLTGKNEARKIKTSKEARQALGADADLLLMEHGAIAGSLLRVLEQRINQSLYALSEAAYRCGDALIAELQAHKASRRSMDHTDVETRAARLLGDDGAAAYLHARLDARYRQVLLDEFQDTNPQQWRALSGWLDAYGGAGAAPAVFMVGDPRQAIYRFRRADPRVFAAAARRLRESRDALFVARDHTRRNAQAIVAVVNAVFAAADAPAGFRPQTTAQAATPGSVECLPLIPYEKPEPDAPGTLRDPLAVPPPDDTDARSLAEGHAIAARLRALAGSVAIEGDDGRPRPAGYGDVMLLVRSRAPVAAYERALREAGIPFLTARLGGLLESIEARDVVALMRFLAQDADDLALAHALKSPLFGCGDDDLLLLARRGEASWWQRLRACGAAGDAPLARALRLIEGWLALAGRLPVHDLLDRVYYEADVVERYRAAAPAHLGARVTANLHAFIELALDLDAGRYPSLTRFIDAIERWRREDASDAPDEGVAAAGGAVRIMTIHGAKGLEAPIVWLADAQRAGATKDVYRMLIDWPPEDGRPAHVSPVFSAALTGTGREAFFAAEARAQADEHLNLLYVAMTRARQALFVSGAQAGREQREPSWYERIEAALAGLGGNPFGGLPAAAQSVAAQSVAAQSVAGPAAEFNGVDLAPAPPTGAGTQQAPLASVGTRLAPETDEIRHGKLRHWVLQRLSEGGTLDEAPVLARRFGLPAAAAEDAVARARATLAAPALARFFTPAANAVARNEAEVVGADGQTRRIDRVVAFDDAVWVLDYKSRLGADVLPGYEAQVRDYMALVAAVYAPRRVRGALIDLARDALVEVGPQER
jgi:ATP-dependent helicase/nuclease subunit A